MCQGLSLIELSPTGRYWDQLLLLRGGSRPEGVGRVAGRLPSSDRSCPVSQLSQGLSRPRVAAAILV